MTLKYALFSAFVAAAVATPLRGSNEVTSVASTIQPASTITALSSVNSVYATATSVRFESPSSVTVVVSTSEISTFTTHTSAVASAIQATGTATGDESCVCESTGFSTTITPSSESIFTSSPLSFSIPVSRTITSQFSTPQSTTRTQFSTPRSVTPTQFSTPGSTTLTPLSTSTGFVRRVLSSFFSSAVTPTSVAHGGTVTATSVVSPTSVVSFTSVVIPTSVAGSSCVCVSGVSPTSAAVSAGGTSVVLQDNATNGAISVTASVGAVGVAVIAMLVL